MRKNTKRFLEDELFAYKDTDKRLKEIREQIQHPWKPTDENIGGSKVNKNISVTEQTATALVFDKRIETLERHYNAITNVYAKCNEVQKELLDNFYFARPRTLTNAGVAQKLCISKRKLYYVKREVIQMLADELGIT